MTWIGLLLMGIAVSDLVFSAVRRSRLGAAVGASLVIGAGLLAGLTEVGDVVCVVALAALVPGWAESVTHGFAGRRPWLPLLVLGSALVALLALSGVAPHADGALGGWLRDSPFLSADVDSDRALLLSGVLLAQLSTGNVVVRLVLAASGTTNPMRGPGRAPPPPLRGGRLLGPMERLFILGLGLAGEVTAASVVIAAKGLLRFPELQAAHSDRSSPGPGIHEVTEYFLVGSFVSWTLSLASLVLVGAPF